MAGQRGGARETGGGVDSGVLQSGSEEEEYKEVKECDRVKVGERTKRRRKPVVLSVLREVSLGFCVFRGVFLTIDTHTLVCSMFVW